MDQQQVYVLNEHRVFVRQFLELYKQHSVLWDQKHPNYRSKTERSIAYQALVEKYREFYPVADEDYVRMKIDSMRNSFRKERRKVLSSQQECADPKDVYKPSLWYYNLLLFIVGEEGANDSSNEGEITITNEENNSIRIQFWTPEHVALLIEYYKNKPCLYTINHPDYSKQKKRIDAVKKITESLTSATSKRFNYEDVRRKILSLRKQYLYECRKIKSAGEKGENYVPNLWCFKMLEFLKEQYTQEEQNVTESPLEVNVRKRTRSSSNDMATSEDEIDCKQESDPLNYIEDHPVDLKNDEVNEDDSDDIFNTIANNVAHKLRGMTEEQRSIAEKILRDLMYHGQMENLTTSSKLSLDGS